MRPPGIQAWTSHMMAGGCRRLPDLHQRGQAAPAWRSGGCTPAADEYLDARCLGGAEFERLGFGASGLPHPRGTGWRPPRWPWYSTRTRSARCPHHGAGSARILPWPLGTLLATALDGAFGSPARGVAVKSRGLRTPGCRSTIAERQVSGTTRWPVVARPRTDAKRENCCGGGEADGG